MNQIVTTALELAEQHGEYLEGDSWRTITRVSNDTSITLLLDVSSELHVFHNGEVVLRATDSYYGDWEVHWLVHGEWLFDLLEYHS